jgi:hypothetical protein
MRGTAPAAGDAPLARSRGRPDRSGGIGGELVTHPFRPIDGATALLAATLLTGGRSLIALGR